VFSVACGARVMRAAATPHPGEEEQCSVFATVTVRRLTDAAGVRLEFTSSSVIQDGHKELERVRIVSGAHAALACPPDTPGRSALLTDALRHCSAAVARAGEHSSRCLALTAAVLRRAISASALGSSRRQLRAATAHLVADTAALGKQRWQSLGLGPAV
jgi:hypothetical protein